MFSCYDELGTTIVDDGKSKSTLFRSGCRTRAEIVGRTRAVTFTRSTKLDDGVHKHGRYEQTA